MPNVALAAPDNVVAALIEPSVQVKFIQMNVFSFCEAQHQTVKSAEKVSLFE